jgi:protein-disulfide isomerase
MTLPRRSLLTLAGAALPGLALTSLARAQGSVQGGAPQVADPFAPRAIGSKDAPVQVTEWFSLTCPHCARFAQETFPQVKAKLVDPGKLRYVFGDFPLDQVALMAAMVARSLPPDRYEPFVMTLFATQDRWAFARDVNSTEELAKYAALAGMPRQDFDKAIANTQLRDAILKAQDQAEKQFGVDSTPTFIFDGPKAKQLKQAGEMGFDTFAGLVTKAGG